ncbi:MAG: hypothetical protein QNJ47_21390 [Nostocaceae cyanobacterium]|nr:hypothetical protein [Nostocaceae cyanobacterium]
MKLINQDACHDLVKSIGKMAKFFMNKLVFLTVIVSPLWLISPTMGQFLQPSDVIAQDQLNQGIYLDACSNSSSFSDVPKEHWAYTDVVNIGSCKMKHRSSVPINNLLAAPNRVTIAGRSYRIETFVWRDFMPGSPESMIANLRLIAEDGNNVPSNLTVDRLWVIKSNGKEVWETTFSDEPRFSPGFVEMVARGGPVWEPDSTVDVVVRLHQGLDQTYFLRSVSQTIQRTD